MLKRTLLILIAFFVFFQIMQNGVLPLGGASAHAEGGVDGIYTQQDPGAMDTTIIGPPPPPPPAELPEEYWGIVIVNDACPLGCLYIYNIPQEGEAIEAIAIVDYTGDVAIAYPILSLLKLGNGTVFGGPISCGTDCSGFDIYFGTSVTLEAVPDSGWAFLNWSGCDTTFDVRCFLTLNSNRTVTATFVPLYTLTMTTAGGGMVTTSPTGAGCYTECSETHTTATSQTLIAVSDRHSIFTGWSGCDTTSGSTCYLTMGSDRNITAAFQPVTYTSNLTVTGISRNIGTIDGGCPITVAGTGFNGDEIVSVGGVIATQALLTSDALITALSNLGTAPAGTPPQALDVMVCDPDYQCSDPLMDNVAFTYVYTGDIKDSQGILGNHDGRVSVGEVQSVINMFLADLDVRPEADSDCDGLIGINEVQQAINSFLTLP